MRSYTFRLTIAAASLCFPLHSSAHEAPLDRYGCHFEGKYYECHKGDFLGLSFDSKPQMLDRLRLQYLAFNRPWPFETDDRIFEEEITSTGNETAAARAVQEHVKEKRKISANSNPSTSKTTTKPSISAPETQPSSVITELSQKVQNAGALRNRSVGSRKPEAPLIDHVVRIESSGRAIFENLDGKRFYLAEDGKKVFLNQDKL
jgi:hypothetical protein